jgi:hypothetical protein
MSLKFNYFLVWQYIFDFNFLFNTRLKEQRTFPGTIQYKSPITEFHGIHSVEMKSTARWTEITFPLWVHALNAKNVYREKQQMVCHLLNVEYKWLQAMPYPETEFWLHILISLHKFIRRVVYLLGLWQSFLTWLVHQLTSIGVSWYWQHQCLH